MTEIDERRQKRAANIVWNCAGRYDFRPDFRAYDVKGRADLYWNCIFGAARKHYDYAVFAQIFAGLQQYEDADTYTDLFWLGLENCVYQRERRGARRWKRFGADTPSSSCDSIRVRRIFNSTIRSRSRTFSRVLGLESRMNKYDSKLLDELEFTPDMTETEIAARAKELFERWFQICTEERRRAQKRSFTHRSKSAAGRTPIPSFAGSALASRKIRRTSTAARRTATQRERAENQDDRAGTARVHGDKVRQEHILSCKNGQARTRALYRQTMNPAICSSHPATVRTRRRYATALKALSRQREAAQIVKNRASYDASLAQNRDAIAKLSSKIQNSALMHLQPAIIRANSGRLDGGRVWRALSFGDSRVFRKTEHDDIGGLSVDILLDASTSQKTRQEIVSAQGSWSPRASRAAAFPVGSVRSAP